MSEHTRHQRKVEQAIDHTIRVPSLLSMQLRYKVVAISVHVARCVGAASAHPQGTVAGIVDELRFLKISVLPTDRVENIGLRLKQLVHVVVATVKAVFLHWPLLEWIHVGFCRFTVNCCRTAYVLN